MGDSFRDTPTKIQIEFALRAHTEHWIRLDPQFAWSMTEPCVLPVGEQPVPRPGRGRLRGEKKPSIGTSNAAVCISKLPV
jgi:hypothetical protein